MKTFNLLSPSAAGAALLALSTNCAQAQPAPSGRSAEEVRAEAVAAAHAPDQNGAAGTRGFGEFKGTADPAQVAAQAREAANAPDQNGAAGTRGFGEFKGAADPAQVAAGAREAASAPDQNVASESKVNSRHVPATPKRESMAVRP